MASLLGDVDEYGRTAPTLSLLTGGPGGSDVGGFLDYLGKQIGDENLRRTGQDPDVARFWQAAVAEHPELRLPATPAAPFVPQPGVPVLSSGANADPYTPFDPQAAIDRINQRAVGDIGMQLGQSFEGGLRRGTPGGNTVRVDLRGPGNVLQDVRPRTADAIGRLFDEHLAANDIALYGAPGRVAAGDITVTLPPGIARAQDITERGQQMVDQATAMTQNVPPGTTPPRYWYAAGAPAIHDLTGQDLEASGRVAGALAITSPQTDVPSNAAQTVNAFNQALLGGPIQVSSGDKNLKLENVLYGEIMPATRKTGPFYENHMRYLDPSFANNLTNDIWQMRQAGFVNANGTPYEGSPTVGEDNYVRMMVARAARQLNAANVDGGGWTPDQVQAALWVHAKTLQQTGNATPASFHFGNAMERLYAAQNNAHEAGPALLGPAASDPQAQAAFQQSGLLTDPLGRDVVNSSLGLLTPRGVPGGAAVGLTADGIKPTSRTLMDASTLIRATLLRQPDALWLSHADVKGEPTIANSSSVQSFSGNPEDHALRLRLALDTAGGGLENAHLEQTPSGVRVVNVGQRTGLTNADFQGMVKRAITEAGLPSDLKRARSDYGYFTHDWTADPTGSGYIAALSRLPPHLQRVGDQLFAQLGGRLDAAGSAVSGLQGSSGPWRIPGFAQSVAPVGQPLPLRPWVQRPSPDDPGSFLSSLLGGAQP